jgi:hypothetical protein
MPKPILIIGYLIKSGRTKESNPQNMVNDSWRKQYDVNQLFGLKSKTYKINDVFDLK